jgi:hypothetical protein
LDPENDQRFFAGLTHYAGVEKDLIGVTRSEEIAGAKGA